MIRWPVELSVMRACVLGRPAWWRRAGPVSPNGRPPRQRRPGVSRRPGQGGRARCGGAESGAARSELTVYYSFHLRTLAFCTVLIKLLIFTIIYYNSMFSFLKICGSCPSNVKYIGNCLNIFKAETIIDIRFIPPCMGYNTSLYTDMLTSLPLFGILISGKGQMNSTES